MKLDKATITLVVSVILNLLGGLGIIDPLVQNPDAVPCQDRGPQ